MQVGDSLVTSIWKAIMDKMNPKMEAIFCPQQVAVGVKGGLGILVHGARALLDCGCARLCVC